MRVTLIYNPKAGETANPEADELMAMIRRAGHNAEYASSKGKHFKSALEAAGDLVAVAGGDGTVAKVAKVLAGRGVPMTVLPTGTANNIAITFVKSGGTLVDSRSDQPQATTDRSARRARLK